MKSKFAIQIKDLRILHHCTSTLIQGKGIPTYSNNSYLINISNLSSLITKKKWLNWTILFI